VTPVSPVSAGDTDEARLQEPAELGLPRLEADPDDCDETVDSGSDVVLPRESFLDLGDKDFCSFMFGSDLFESRGVDERIVAVDDVDMKVQLLLVMQFCKRPYSALSSVSKLTREFG